MLINSPMKSNCCEGISGIVAGCVCEYAAACQNSYPGRGQYWENLIQYKSPADSLPLSSGPLILGTSVLVAVSDPTFIGRAGQKGSYFLIDAAGKLFGYSGQISTDPKSIVAGYASNWHKTTGGQNASFIITMEYHSSGTYQSLFTTAAYDGTGIGISGYINPAGKLGLTQTGDTGNASIVSAKTLVDGTKYIIGFAWSKTIQGIWLGSSSAELGATDFNTTISDPTTPLSFGVNFNTAVNSGTFGWQIGTKIYDILLFNTAITNGNMASIITYLENRNGLDFTP